MATVGRTTQGASVRAIEGRPYARQVSFTAGDQVTAINAWVRCDTNPHNMNVRILDASGNGLATGTERSISTGTGADEAFTISYTVSSTGNYLIMVYSQNVGGAAECFYDAGSETSYFDSDISNGYPMGANWDAGFATDNVNDDISIYATYTPAGGSPTTITGLGKRFQGWTYRQGG